MSLGPKLLRGVLTVQEPRDTFFDYSCQDCQERVNLKANVWILYLKVVKGVLNALFFLFFLNKKIFIPAPSPPPPRLVAGPKR